MKRAACALAVALGLVVPAIAGAGPKDDAAQKVLKDAVDKDYLETKFDPAVQKLRGALAACGASGCSPTTRANLYLALGGVLASGKKQLTDAKDAFVEALNIDKNAQPPADLASPETTFAFEQAKKELKIGAAPPPPPPPKKAVGTGNEGDMCDESSPCREGLNCRFGTCKVPDAEAPKPEEPANKAGRYNWITILFSPDVSLISGSDVCTANSRANNHYVCLRNDRSNYAGTPTLGNADDVTTGMAAGTMRVTLGYERILLENLGLGAKVGFQFNAIATGPTPVLPIYFEARASYYIGKKPFASLGARPSFFLSGGVAEVDGSANVNVLEDGTACGAAVPSNPASPCTIKSKDGVLEPRTQTIVAYKQLGPGFIGGGFAIAFAPSDAVSFNLGLRVSATVPVVALVLAPEGGFAMGF